MEAFFFGDSRTPLFGAYYTPEPSRASGKAVVVCPAFGQEHLRSFPALIRLCRALAAVGVATLRFDYRGTGDSHGDPKEVRLGDWVEDLGTAVRELKEVSDYLVLYLIGLRLGASIAGKFLSPAIGGPSRLCLWHPVLDGRAYLEELASCDKEYSLETGCRVPRRGAPPESLGFPVAARLKDDLHDLDFSTAGLEFTRGVVVANEDSIGARRFAERRGLAWVGRPSWEFWRKNRAGSTSSLIPYDEIGDIVRWVSGN